MHINVLNVYDIRPVFCDVVNLFFYSFPREKKAIIDPSLFKYKVQPIKKELYETVIVRASQLR